jgi:hypothetical protein
MFLGADSVLDPKVVRITKGNPGSTTSLERR